MTDPQGLTAEQRRNRVAPAMSFTYNATAAQAAIDQIRAVMVANPACGLQAELAELFRTDDIFELRQVLGEAAITVSLVPTEKLDGMLERYAGKHH